MPQPTILSLPRLTAQSYRVHASCGHAWTVAALDVKEQQLYVGKPVTCEACQKLHTQGKL
jgi:hypothetical protein